MTRRPFNNLCFFAAPAIVGWILLFLRQFDRFAGVGLLAPWLSLGLIGLSGAALWVFCVRSPTRWALLAVGLLTFAGGIAFTVAQRDAASLDASWRRSESLRVATVLVAVGERVQNLQVLSSSIGEEVGVFLRERASSSTSDTLGTRLEAFRILGELASRTMKSDKLPAGAGIGIQVFGADGDRLAWAGWPQQLAALDRRFVATGTDLRYSRQVSLYRILTHIIPILGPDGRAVATVVVDMPLEVNYKVNNKFLTSTSLVDNVTRGGTANVRFEYALTPASLPSRLARYQAEVKAVPLGTPLGEAEVPSDSLHHYVAFPSYVTPIGRVGGDEQTGLSGRAVIRSAAGNPLFTLTVFGRPLRYFADAHRDRWRAIAGVLMLIALIGYAVLLFARFPQRFAGPLNAGKALCIVAFFVLVRYWLLHLLGGLPIRQQLFDPAIFATPILGGVMRSAGDLLITAVLFVMALYGVLKVTRSAVESHALRRPDGWLFLPRALVAAGVLLGSIELVRRFVRSVVVNANPRLLGDTMRLLESHASALHLSSFLMIAGIFLAGLICIWGVYRFHYAGDSGRSSIGAAGIILILCLMYWGWAVAFIALSLLLFVVFAPRIVHREDLVSIVIVSFAFVIIVATAAYLFLNAEYQGLRQTFAREKVTEITHPADNWKVFILEDALETFSQSREIQRALVNPASPNTRHLAFDLWATSPLSLLGYSSAIHVFNVSDSLVSRFTVEMPYRVHLSEATERFETASSQEWVVLDLTTDTPQGKVRFYRGIANINSYAPSLTNDAPRSLGKVVVDMPFFFENLAWAARTGPQTPEVLRNVQEGGIEPRIEEPEALLLARLTGTRVLESSSDILPVGLNLEQGLFDKALGNEWPLLKAADHTFRVRVEPTDDPDSYLLAGFQVPLPHQHVLLWSTIFSLYLFFAVSIIVLLILLGSLPGLRYVLPTLTPGRQLGFQQKLLGSFLVVALLPAVILGVFSVRLIKGRFVEENRKEALTKVYSARKSISNLLVGELNYLLDRSDLGELLVDGTPSSLVRDRSRVVRMLTGADVDADVIERFPPEQVFIDRIGDEPFIAVLSHPISVVLDGETQKFVVYYARVLNNDLLGEIADQVGNDVNLFDGGELIATSREGLVSGGFISSMMNATAFVKVSIMDVDQTLASERAGSYRYEVAYIPMRSAGAYENAALGLPLLFRPESYSVEVQKATSIVLSIFGLLAAATIGLGLLLARGIFEPLKILLEGTRRISRGDLSFKLPSKRRDEIGTVVEAFNEMTSQLSRSQRALEERRRYLEVILDNIGTGVISTDENDRIRAVNNAAEKILGIRGDDVYAKSGVELAGENVVPEFFSLLARRASGGKPVVSSEVDVTTEGHKRTIKYIQTDLRMEDKYMGAVYVFEDLTELINSKKLSAWVEMSRQIAHEIKNPLTPIKLSAQFMLRAHDENADDFNKIFKEGSATIIHQVEVLRRIASEFSSFGRMQQLDIVKHEIVPRLEEMVKPYRRNQSGVEVTLDCPNPRVSAQVDTEAFRKICTNLIENALEAMPGGGVLRITCTENPENGHGGVAVSFRDTGPGLSEDAREKLFEPYFSTKTTGTGLGLAICRSLSREMGGDVVVDNLENGGGVEATLYLAMAT